MGGILSGNYGRTSHTPYLEDLERVNANDLRRTISIPSDTASWQFFPHGDEIHKILVSTIRTGLGGRTTQLRFRCPTCDRRCVLLFYLDHKMACGRCAGRYRCQSESPRRRTLRKAHKILDKTEFDDSYPDGRVRYRKHSVHERLKERALWACEVICGRDEKLSELIKYVDQHRSLRKRTR